MSIASGLQRLRALGFTPTGTRAAHRVFAGVLHCKAGDVPVQFEISDWDFTSYPRISLLERPAFFPPLMPHISASGGICYFAQGSVVLDRFRPDTAIWQCIEQARMVIDRAIDDPQYHSDEFRGEFWANWLLAQDPPALPGLIGAIEKNTTTARYYLIGPDDGRRLYVASEPDEVSRFCEALGWPAPTLGMPCWILRSERVPALPTGGLPQTVHTTFEWLKAWDQKLYRAIQTRLAERDYLKWSRCELAIATPVGWIGFGFKLHAMTARGFARRPKEYRNYLHQRGGSTAIQRSVFQDVSPDYVYQRNLVNLQRGTLAGKKIALVGCGAIGGYLASALLRLGAGTAGGTLHLQDVDELQPDNLGRHRLGYNSLFDNKATALKKMLDRESPFANITISEKSAVDYFPQGFDLVINATGEQVVSEALNVQHVQASKRTPLLHVWIFGNGDCVQGLWVDSRKYACYRCLTHNDEAQYGQPRFPLTDADTLRAFVGCHAFTPYGVSSPMSATALAMDFIGDWLKGDVSPRFRLRYNEGSTLRRFKSQNVSPLQGCPACQPQ